jgi:hypothetical protein
VKQRVKLLKGKRLASALGLRGSAWVLPCLLPGGWASVGWGFRTKARGMWPTSVGVTAPGAIRSPRPRTAAYAKDAGVMESSVPS